MKCSNCGEIIENIESDDTFCPNCGHKLDNKPEINDVKPSGKGLGKLLGIIAAIIVAVIAAAFILNHLKSNNGGVGSLIYLKDNDLVNYYGSKQIEIGDKVFKDEDDAYNIGYNVRFTKDGSRLLYPQKYEDGSFTLYVSNPHSNKDDGIKIDTGVVDYELAGNKKVVYKKEGKKSGLYVADFDGNREKIDDSATGFWIDENGKNVLYTQSNKDSLDVYIADLSLKEKPVKIASKIDYLVSISSNLDLIYYKKNDSLYEIENFGDSEKILSHVADVYVKIDEDVTSLYVLVDKNELKTIPLKNLVEDISAAPNYDVEIMLKNYLTDYYNQELYYYSKRSGKILLAEGNISYCVGTNEAFLYNVLTGTADEKLSIEKLNKMDYDKRYEVIEAFKTKNSSFRINVSGFDYALDNSFEDYYWNEDCFNWYDKVSNLSFISLIDKESGASVLAKVDLASGGKVEIICDDFAKMASCVNGKLYYSASMEEDGFEIYENGKLLDSDVEYYYVGRDKESLLYVKDSDGNSGTLMLHKGGKSTKISEDVYTFVSSENGDVALISDFDEDDLEGDLKLYHNGKVQKIDSEVSYIVNFD